MVRSKGVNPSLHPFLPLARVNMFNDDIPSFAFSFIKYCTAFLKTFLSKLVEQAPQVGKKFEVRFKLLKQG